MDDIRKAILGARASQVNRIMGSISNAAEVCKDESALAKAKEAESEEEMTAEEPSSEEAEKEEDGQKESDGKNEKEEEEVEETEDETEKAHIMEALSYGNDIKVSKTGKEIKAQVKDVLIPKLNAELEEWKGKADGFLEACGKAPTKTPAPWWTADTEIEVPYKIYDWNETYIPSEERGSISYETLSAEDAAAKKGNVPENADQAKARNDYNEAVRMVCNVLVDLKACDILLALKDGKEYELTPRQVLTLGFGS